MSVLSDFRDGQSDGSGSLIAKSLAPTTSRKYPDRLASFYYAFDPATTPEDLSPFRLALFGKLKLRVLKPEQDAWIDVYYAYWKAVGEIVKFERSPRRASWEAVFEAYKLSANALIRGYSSGGIPNWTLPCLYVVGKYLRIFAMKADKEIISRGPYSFGDRFQDDLIADTDNAKLEEAARVINRMFTLCLNDRLVSSLLLPVEIVC